MASPLSESAVEAVELDAFAKDIPSLIQHDESLYRFFHENATVVPVSNVTAAGGVSRPAFRVPARVQGGSAITQGTGDGDSLGRGTGSTWAGFALSPVFLFNVCELTYLSRIATDGRKRGLFNVQAQELNNSFKQFIQGVDSLIPGDGSGYLDIIPASATINNGTGSGQSLSSIVGLNNAFRFQDQQVIQVFSAVGGTNRGKFTVSFSDPVTNTIYSAQSLPAGTVVGDYLIVAGASGSAGGSILGIAAWAVNSNTGTIGGLNRANFPGRLSTPTINLSGKSISMSTGMRARTLLLRALGSTNQTIKSASWIVGPDQAMQIGNLYLNMLNADATRVQGQTMPDVVKKNWPATYAGDPVQVCMDQTPGRLDLLCADFWYLGELLPAELYDFGGGLTVVPVPDITNGGYLTSSLFSYTCAFNLANSNPRAGCFITSAAQPLV
ncbi:MAG: hypothetical protein ACRD2E_08910 [Terriglobales bacterium]